METEPLPRNRPRPPSRSFTGHFTSRIHAKPRSIGPGAWSRPCILHPLEDPLMKARSTSKSEGVLLPSLQRTLSRHLAKFPLPYRACSCMTIERGKVNLAVRFVANAGSWSHIAQGTTLGDAFRLIRRKLLRDFRSLGPDATLAKCGLSATQSCGHHSCANAGRCPNRHASSTFVEVAAVDFTDEDPTELGTIGSAMSSQPGRKMK